MNFSDFDKSYDTIIMGFTDTFNYVLFKNPVSSTVIDTTKNVGGSLWGLCRTTNTNVAPSVAEIPKHLRDLTVNRIVFSGSPYIKMAGASGALAVILGAYGAHSLLIKPGLEERKKVFETANRYHFIHTLALLGVPLSRCPKTVSSVMTMGMIVFCGTCYYDAFTGDTRFRKYTPVGGSLLVLGWICFLL